MVWHGTRRYDSRNGVFVNHLANGVFQQNYKLIKGLDLPLQLDAIDQINGHWNMLPAQDVQKRVLKELPFVAHDMFRVQELL